MSPARHSRSSRRPRGARLPLLALHAAPRCRRAGGGSTPKHTQPSAWLLTCRPAPPACSEGPADEAGGRAGQPGVRDAAVCSGCCRPRAAPAGRAGTGRRCGGGVKGAAPLRRVALHGGGPCMPSTPRGAEGRACPRSPVLPAAATTLPPAPPHRLLACRSAQTESFSGSAKAVSGASWRPTAGWRRQRSAPWRPRCGRRRSRQAQAAQGAPGQQLGPEGRVAEAGRRAGGGRAPAAAAAPAPPPPPGTRGAADAAKAPFGTLSGSWSGTAASACRQLAGSSRLRSCWRGSCGRRTWAPSQATAQVRRCDRPAHSARNCHAVSDCWTYFARWTAGGGAPAVMSRPLLSAGVHAPPTWPAAVLQLPHPPSHPHAGRLRNFLLKRREALP